MLKARTTGGTIILGLTDGNLRLLRDGRPIHILGRELGLEGCDIVVLWGEDGPAICKVLEGAGLEVPPGAAEQAAENEFPLAGGKTRVCPECGGAVWKGGTDVGREILDG